MSDRIDSQRAPEPVGAYPHARRVGNLLFLSGIGPRVRGSREIPGVRLRPDGTVESYDIEAQCRSVFANVRAVLEEAGSSWEKLVDVTVFLTNMRRDFAANVKEMGVEVTERCKVTRVICMELDRIFSHLLWLGTTAIDIGAFTVFLYTFQERERIAELALVDVEAEFARRAHVVLVFLADVFHLLRRRQLRRRLLVRTGRRGMRRDDREEIRTGDACRESGPRARSCRHAASPTNLALPKIEGRLARRQPKVEAKQFC